MVLNATFHNISVISWRSVLFVKETGGSGENHRLVASLWQTLSHNVVHLALRYGEFANLTYIENKYTWQDKMVYIIKYEEHKLNKTQFFEGQTFLI
jgi:hypothetical protein